MAQTQLDYSQIKVNTLVSDDEGNTLQERNGKLYNSPGSISIATTSEIGGVLSSTSENELQINGQTGKGTINGLTAALANRYLKSETYSKAEVDAVLSSVYKPAGSVAFANLPTPSEQLLGNVYNVTDSFTTTSDFVEGAGKTYPAGTNVVIVTQNSAYKFDVLAGLVDLSSYYTSIQTDTAIATAIAALLGRYVNNEAVGSGTGSATVFTLAYTPLIGSVHVKLNGVEMTAGSSNDYTISGAAITFNYAPPAGSRVTADYIKES